MEVTSLDDEVSITNTEAKWDYEQFKKWFVELDHKLFIKIDKNLSYFRLISSLSEIWTSTEFSSILTSYFIPGSVYTFAI